MARWVFQWASPKAIRLGFLTLLFTLIVYISAHLSHAYNDHRIETKRKELVKQELMGILSRYTNGETPAATGLVMAKTKKEDVTWVLENCKEHANVPFIYTTEPKPEKGLLVPRTTRGREVAAYLSYIIDFYDHLPKYSIFIHATHDQWHNDILGPETLVTLPHVRLQAVDAHGFINLRCAHTPGCPVAVNPRTPSETDIKKKDIRAYFAQAYQELFDVPIEKVPEHIGNVCCAQFAVSRERIRARPRSDYERMLNWAHGTSLTHDFGVGWVFEKVWHIIFLMDTVHAMNNAAVIIMGGVGHWPPVNAYMRWAVSRHPPRPQEQYGEQSSDFFT